MTLHKNIALGAHHVPYNWTYDNEAARLAASGFANSDLGKLARQLDDNSLWMLTATTPVWTSVSGGLLHGELDGYASDATVSEHYNQFSAAIHSILKDLDGYSTTDQEHYVQLSEALQTVLKDLDGYESRIQENKQDHSTDMKAILDVIDGYAEDTELAGLVQTEMEHYIQHSDVVQTIRKDLDGYAADSTVSDHYAQHAAALHSVVKDLDGYALVTTEDQRWSDSSEQRQALRDAADGYGASFVIEDQRWVDSSEQRQGIRDALDGYALDSVEDQRWADASEQLQGLRDAADGYLTAVNTGVAEITFQENKDAWNDMFDTIRKDLDGYALDSDLDGLDGTVQEHKTFVNDALDTVLKDLDGYATTTALAGLETTVEDHKNSHGDDVKAIIDVLDGYADQADTSGIEEALHDIIKDLDGYALDSDLDGLDGTVQEHKDQFGEHIQTILKDLDGYSASSGLSQTTFQENKNAWNSALETIIDGLDGYATTTLVANDGYNTGHFHPSDTNAYNIGESGPGSMQWAKMCAESFRSTLHTNMMITEWSTATAAAEESWTINEYGGDGVGDNVGDGVHISHSSVRFQWPYNTTSDGYGNIYVSVGGNPGAEEPCVRKIDVSTENITTYVGNGTFGDPVDGTVANATPMKQPCGVAFDSANNMYVHSRENNITYKVEYTDGKIYRYAGTGGVGGSTGNRLSVAAFGQCWGYMATDTNDHLYICDDARHKIVKVDKDTGQLSHWCGTDNSAGNTGDGGAVGSAKLSGPTGVVFDKAGQYAYISDTGNNRIRRVDLAAGTIAHFAGQSGGSSGFGGDEGAASSATLNNPYTPALSPDDGYLTFSDRLNYRIRSIKLSTGIISTLTGNGDSAACTGDGVPAAQGRHGVVYGLCYKETEASNYEIYFNNYTNNFNWMKQVLYTPETPEAAASPPFGADVSVEYKTSITDEGDDGYTYGLQSDGYGAITDEPALGVTFENVGLIGSMTTAERDSIQKFKNGMIIYNETLNKFQGLQAGVWTNLDGT